MVAKPPSEQTAFSFFKTLQCDEKHCFIQSQNLPHIISSILWTYLLPISTLFVDLVETDRAKFFRQTYAALVSASDTHFNVSPAIDDIGFSDVTDGIRYR